MRDDAERAKLYIAIREPNHALLNRQTEQATAKRCQQAGAGEHRNHAPDLRMPHHALYALAIAYTIDTLIIYPPGIDARP